MIRTPHHYGILSGTFTVMKVAGVTHRSSVNGPGRRNVLHMQGCTLGCPGCFNKHTWDGQGGKDRTIEQIVSSLTEGSFDGITISGGEPLQQIEPLLTLVSYLNSKYVPYGIPIIMYTGYSLAEILKGEILLYQLKALGVDAMVCGRYERRRAVKDRGLVSSANQEVILLSDYYEIDELDSGPSGVEVIIEEDGEVRLSGFPTQKVLNQIRRES